MPVMFACVIHGVFRDLETIYPCHRTLVGHMCCLSLAVAAYNGGIERILWIRRLRVRMRIRLLKRIRTLLRIRVCVRVRMRV